MKYTYEQFGCYLELFQSDNGYEFRDKARKKDKGVNIRTFDNFLESFLKENIINYLIRPRTPEHNSEVKRSHRIDQDKLYRYLKVYNLNDPREQGKR